MNAFKYASEKHLLYVEGYVLIAGIPLLIEHAWCCEKGKNVAIDPTLGDKGRHYFGVEMSETEVWAEISRNRVYGVLNTGVRLNIEFMFRKDPGLKKEFENEKAKMAQ